LIEFNGQFLGTDAREPLAVFARDADGSIVGGLSGVVSRGWLHVELLWVAPEMRGAGLGRELVERAERRARERSCAGVLVETYDFQALSFYEAGGYERFATLDGYPVGSRQHYLAKRL
jgi:GNAT superfamily N-acetyltransferase